MNIILSLNYTLYLLSLIIGGNSDGLLIALIAVTVVALVFILIIILLVLRMQRTTKYVFSGTSQF